MEKEQQRSKEIVERTSRDAKAASRASQQGGQGEGGVVPGDPDGLRSPSQPHDAISASDENTRRQKVTADRWNP